VDECVTNLAVGRPGQQVVAIRQLAGETEQRPREVFGGITIVMKMDFDLAIAGRAQIGECFHVFAPAAFRMSRA